MTVGGDRKRAAAVALEYPETFWALVARRACDTPSRRMLVDDLGRELSSGGYAARCEQVAAGLLNLYGVGAGTVVSWQLPTGFEALVLMGALARLGATQNPLIPLLREREVGFITQQVGTDLLIVPEVHRGFDHGAMARSLADTHGFEVLSIDFDELEAGVTDPSEIGLPVGDPRALPPPPQVDGERWIYYSSGTTADPKGLRHTDRSVMYSATGLVAVLELGERDVYPIAFPVAHIGGMSNLTAQLMTGATLALSATFDRTDSPRFMSEVGATLLGSAAPFFTAYLDAQAVSDEPLFPHLRAGVNGGAPKPPGLHEAVRTQLGGVGVIGSWGLTEFPLAAMGSPHDSDDQMARTEGPPVPGVEIRVVDQAGLDVPAGEEGELWLRGPQQFVGYVDASLDADAIVDGWLRTGDLGTVDPTGHVTVTGRLKDIIIRNAENLSALEIENAVATHPSVAEVAVIGLPDDRTGERACAVVAVREGHAAPSISDLSGHCRDIGLAVQKVPEQLETIDVLPRNSLGKVVKRELRDLYLTGEQQ